MTQETIHGTWSVLPPCDLDIRSFLTNFPKIRSQADEIFLRHASHVGARVFEETKVTDVEFDGVAPNAYPKAALWKNKQGETGRITFDYVIDASGRAGILSVKYLHSRQFNQDLKNVAVWGYWKGAGKYLPGSTREGSPLFEALEGNLGLFCY